MAETPQIQQDTLIGTSHTNSVLPKNTPDDFGGQVGSPLTPTVNVSTSTPHEPSQRRSLVECFEKMLRLDDEEEADLYDSDGNEPPRVDGDQFFHFEDDIGEVIGGEAEATETAGKFVFLDDNAINALKVDELKIELDKRSLSKTGLKAELRERLKKAMIDQVPVVDVEKNSAGPNGFDLGCQWRLIDPSSPAIEPVCEDQTLLDPSSNKYQASNKKSDEEKK